MKEGISISKTEWIKWVDFEEPRTKSLNIDGLMGSVKDLLNRLEVHCAADCCGVDAFSFWKEDIKSVASKMDKGSILSDLKKLKAIIPVLDSNELESIRLNTVFPKPVFTQLVDHMIVSIEG
ncbi:DUF6331 family protein [Emticicia agri]|uniref:Uncharacterized protein n=1 Tax=Emticicia agri TaxID=2492393 RepID=A0A4V1ZCR6_9BACT|nr:DUF6331 family protein [Emticicia agri]RYU93590.1 hypothetical protein EWM59_21320 [Emticicia agri]